MPDNAAVGAEQMFEAVTENVRVQVRPAFLGDESSPAQHRFLWAYHVRIANEGTETVQLLSRHWKITDAMGRLHEVRGEGVVGKQPTLRPGESFEYTSGAPLETPSGFMVGSYMMLRESGGHIEIAIPAFPLDSPYAAQSVH